MTALDWLPADWPAPANVIGGSTLRRGGVSSGTYASLNLGAHVGDDADAVRTNRRRFIEACRLPAEPRWLNQVHGARVTAADAASAKTEADAGVTGKAGVVCAVLTADCLPVLFASRNGGEVAAAHAGWRGLSSGILEATVGALGTPAGELLAWLGPAISRAAFEVGGEVREAFVREHARATEFFLENGRGRWQADLYGLARLRLAECGVSSIYGGGRCTYGERDAFFSYRRDGQCGRMATFVFRTS